MKIHHLDQWTAIILVVGSFILLIFGIDSEVKSILLLAAGWAFGTAYQERKVKK